MRHRKTRYTEYPQGAQIIVIGRLLVALYLYIVKKSKMNKLLLQETMEK